MIQDVSDAVLRQARELGIVPTTDAEWEAYINEDLPASQRTVDMGLAAEDEIIIEDARQDILTGLTDTVKGRLRLIRGLLTLKDADRWKHDPIIAHLENPGWKDYLREVVEWVKERNPALQAGLSTLQNYMRYHQLFVEGYGFEPDQVFGATEQTRRAILKMAKWDYGAGLPKELRNGYDIDKLPAPESAKTRGEKIVEGIRQVAQQAFALGTYQPSLFKAYERGTGEEKTTISMKLEIGEDGMVAGWTAFIEKVDGEGNPLASYAVNLFLDEVPGEVYDWLEARGWKVECA